VSDIQHETEQVVDAPEASGDRERREARERAYQDVSLRAVELLAKAQRAADEAVAEAQAYARDLEETAREQYRHILQRAHEAARGVAGDGAAQGSEDGAAPADPAALAAATSSGAVDTQQLEYVRTYARVAHSQLKAVLGALNDELDRLADLADGRVDGSESSEVPAPAVAEQPREDEVAEDEGELGHG
jgi:hypothetical protein